MSSKRTNRATRAGEAQIATQLAALGNATRLRAYRLLVKAGPEGLNIGLLQSLLDIPASTLAHHLGVLARAEIVRQERQGREVLCYANYETMHALVAYLTEACCAGISLTRDADAA
jgi:DNA-binding transcriptional ArsR family regulator